METVAETNRILQSANNNVATEPKRTKKVKKKKVVSSRVPSGMKTAEHYRLNLAEIPFVAGTVSTTKPLFKVNWCKRMLDYKWEVVVQKNIN